MVDQMALRAISELIMLFRFNRFDQLEVAMYPWVMNCRRDNVTLSDKSIREEAFRVAERLGMRGGGNEYQFYGGSKWLKTFKARFGIVNGVATRLGYSDGDLAREKAYGRYPLDEGFWNAMPDENGNFPDPWRISESKRKHMDYEIIDGVLQYIPREDASGEATVSSPEEAPVSSNSDGAPFEVADDPVPSLATPISVEVSAELFSSELGCLPLDPSITLPSPFLSSDSANASSTHPSGPTSFPTSTEEVTFLQHTIAPSFSPPYLPCDTLTASPFAAPGLPGRAVAQPTVLLSGTLPPSSHVSYSPSDTPSYSLPHLSSPDASTFPPLVFHSPHAPPSLSAELGAALDFPDVSSFPSSTFGSPSTSSVESSVTHSPPLLPPQYTLPNDAHSVDCWSGTTSGVVSQITVGHLPTHTLGPASYSPFDHFPDTENPDVLQCQWMAGQPTYTAGWMAADAMPCITASTRKP